MSVWTDDATCLLALELEAQGKTKREIAARLGISRNAAIGGLLRINRATDDAERDSTARRSQNQDGGMPAHWWRAGMSKQLTKRRSA